MNLPEITKDLASRLEEAEKGKTKGINIVPKYLKFETPGDEFVGVFLGAAARTDVDQETGEEKNVNVCSFMDKNEQVHETLSAFIFQRLQNIEPGKVVKIIYTGEKAVVNTKNAKVKLFDIFIF